MSEELLHEETHTEENAMTMADLEEHFDDANPWNLVTSYMEKGTILPVKVEGIVNGGAIAMVEGLRGFIPASKLSDGYVEDLETFNGKTIGVTVITADKEHKKLVLSGREVARQKRKEEKNARIAKCEVGAVMEGTVDSIMPYGAFIELENGLSGLLHVSRISKQRIKHPSVVLKEGQKVTVKIISTENNKISLSMKDLAEEPETETEVFDYKETGAATTGLGALLKGIKLN